MALEQPKAVSKVNSIREPALALAGDLARIALTKFRVVSGGIFVVLSVLVFFAGDSLEIGRHFRPAFADHAWLAAKCLFFAGLAFAGPDVVKSVLSLWKGTVQNAPKDSTAKS